MRQFETLFQLLKLFPCGNQAVLMTFLLSDRFGRIWRTRIKSIDKIHCKRYFYTISVKSPEHIFHTICCFSDLSKLIGTHERISLAHQKAHIRKWSFWLSSLNIIRSAIVWNRYFFLLKNRNTALMIYGRVIKEATLHYSS